MSGSGSATSGVVREAGSSMPRTTPGYGAMHERRLAAATESVKQAQEVADRAQSELFEVNSQAEGRMAALMSENSILVEGAQRAQARISVLESDLATALKATSGAADADCSTDEMGGSSGTAVASSERGFEQERKALQQKVSDLHVELRNVEETNRLTEQQLRDLRQIFVRAPPPQPARSA